MPRFRLRGPSPEAMDPSLRYESPYVQQIREQPRAPNRQLEIDFSIIEAAKILDVPRKRLLELARKHHVPLHRPVDSEAPTPRKKRIPGATDASRSHASRPTAERRGFRRTLVSGADLEQLGKAMDRETVVKAAINAAAQWFWEHH